MTITLTTRTARFSEDRVYRFRLGRYWDDSKPPLTWLMLNPSIADENIEDPTIRRTMGFTHVLRDFQGKKGFGGVEIVNMFALISTDPKALLAHPDPVGPANDQHILAAASLSDGLVVCAWGDLKQPSMVARALRVCRDLTDLDISLFYLSKTKRGMPGHPLYLPGTLTPRHWTDWETMR